MGTVEAWRFKAFISYSHAADGKLAPALQDALQGFTKPWYALRACRIFRDATTLSVTSELWPAIERALMDSEFFILLASPEAAASKWVGRELERWCEARPVQNILLVLTDGAIVWDAAADDFDWTKTTAIPASLAGRFRQEPLHLDLRWARTDEELSRRHPRFLEAIADISAALRGLSKDELIGRDVREHRRTRRLVRVVIAALLALTTASAAATVQATRALRLAEQRRVQARGVAETIVFELDESLRGIPEADQAREALATKAQALLDAIGGETADYRVLRARMKQHIQRGEAALASGEFDAARREHEECLVLARAQLGEDPMNGTFRRDVSVCLNNLGDVLTKLRDYDAAARYLDEGLAIARELLERDRGNAVSRTDVAISLEKLGQLCLAKGDLACAVRYLDEDLAIMRELHQQFPTNQTMTHGLAVALVQSAELWLQENELAKAEALLVESVELNRALDREHPDNAVILRNLSVGMLKLGDVYTLRGDLPGARRAFEETIGLRRALLRRNPANPARQHDVAIVLGRLGSTLLESGDDSASVPYLQEAVGLHEGLLGQDRSDTNAWIELWLSLDDLSEALIRGKKFAEARPHLARGIEILRGLGGKAGLLQDLFRNLRRAGMVELELQNATRAAELHREACDVATRIDASKLDEANRLAFERSLDGIAAAHRESAIGDRDISRLCAAEALRVQRSGGTAPK